MTTKKQETSIRYGLFEMYYVGMNCTRVVFSFKMKALYSFSSFATTKRYNNKWGDRNVDFLLYADTRLFGMILENGTEERRKFHI